MIRYQHVELTLEGLDEFTTPLARAIGKLDIAENVEVISTKDMRKRRGYRRVDTEQVVARFDADSVFTRVVNHNGRLLLFTYSYVAELGSRSGALRGTDTLVYRGPSNRGNVSTKICAVSRSSSNST